ncbi:hypothetical protein GN956_G3535 [Arapaima gigas]
MAARQVVLNAGLLHGRQDRSFMWAPEPQIWLRDDAVPTAVAVLWAAMALEGRCGNQGAAPGHRGRRWQQRRQAPGPRTRLHGLRHVCSRGTSLGRRAFWLLALCTSLGLLLSWSSNRLLHWLSFPTYTKVHTEWAKELPFPTVTICNNNPIRFYKLTKSDLYFAGHWLGLLLANRTAQPLVLDLLQGDRRAWFRKLSDFRLFLPPRHFEGTNLEFMDRLSHQLDDMLLSCKYRGEMCGPQNFSSVSPSRAPTLGLSSSSSSSFSSCSLSAVLSPGSSTNYLFAFNQSE